MTKKSFLYAFGFLAIFSSCQKSENLTGPTDTSVGYVSFTNVNANNKLTNVLVDGIKVSNIVTTFTNGATTTAVLQNSTIGGTYFGIVPGSHTLTVKDSNTTTAINYLTAPITVNAGQSYSFFLYDTLNAGNLKGVLLTTDRSPATDPLNAKVRFLNLAPRSPAFDLWVIRMQGSSPKDSVQLFSNVPYLGNVANPDITALSTFKQIIGSQAAGAISAGSAATNHIVRLKLAGTNTIVISTAAANIVPGRNYTYYTRGIYGTASFALSSMLSN